MNLEQTRQAVIGDWTSIAPELRPSAQKNPDGSPRPFYLRREFKAFAGDGFELTLLQFADPLGQAPLARLRIQGHMFWRGEHPIAAAAQKVDFVADQAYEITPLLQGFADLLNQVATEGFTRWEVGQTQSIFGKDFAPFGLKAGQNFMEYDLVHLAHGMLFWGARHVDGRGFDTEQNRPTHLQIPLVRKPAEPTTEPASEPR
ncbi:MAG: hypothetical protein JOY84_18685 [Curvibacter sp.]|nr:hypothetical protein [Curvibacter sp.]